MTDQEPAKAMRCADWAREQHVEPVGTAPCSSGFLLLEWPLPWPLDIAATRELTPVADACRQLGIRLQAIASIDRASGGRLVLYRRPSSEWFAGYRRVEMVVPRDELPAAALALVADTPPSPASQVAGPRDLLVCAHGRRDACCGARGMSVVTELATTSVAYGPVRVWRTSHLGGHRFAPTVVVLPEGTCWAFMDADALIRIVWRYGELGELLPRYRGCTGISAPAAQALEREAFAAVGWAWLDWQRHAVASDDGEVMLEGISPAGQAAVWRARLKEGRVLPVPLCRQALTNAQSFTTEIALSDVRRMDRT